MSTFAIFVFIAFVAASGVNGSTVAACAQSCLLSTADSCIRPCEQSCIAGVRVAQVVYCARKCTTTLTWGTCIDMAIRYGIEETDAVTEGASRVSMEVSSFLERYVPASISDPLTAVVNSVVGAASDVKKVASFAWNSATGTHHGASRCTTLDYPLSVLRGFTPNWWSGEAAPSGTNVVCGNFTCFDGYLYEFSGKTVESATPNTRKLTTTRSIFLMGGDRCPGPYTWPLSLWDPKKSLLPASVPCPGIALMHGTMVGQVTYFAGGLFWLTSAHVVAQSLQAIRPEGTGIVHLNTPVTAFPHFDTGDRRCYEAFPGACNDFSGVPSSGEFVGWSYHDGRGLSKLTGRFTGVVSETADSVVLATDLVVSAGASGTVLYPVRAEDRQKLCVISAMARVAWATCRKQIKPG